MRSPDRRWPSTPSSFSEVRVYRKGYRVLGVHIDGHDIAGAVRRIEIIEDAAAGPMVRIELMAHGYIEEIEPDPEGELAPVPSPVDYWPDI